MGAGIFILAGLFCLFVAVTRLVEDKATREMVVWHSLGVGFLFFWWKTYELFSHESLRYCLFVPILVGLIWIISSFTSKQEGFTLPLKAATALITIGVLSLLLAIITFSDSTSQILGKYRLSLADEFSIGWNVGQGVICLGAGLFLLFPPNMSGLWSEMRGKDNTIIGAFSDMKTPSTPLGFSNENSLEDTSDDEMIDRMLSDIMNAGTNLDELSRTNPNLAGKIQSTFDYYNPNAGVFGSWAKRIHGEGRTKLLEVLNKEQQLLIEQAALFEQKVREGAKSQVEFRIFLAQNALQFIELRTKAKLNAKAFQKEMLPEDWSRVRTEQEFLDIRIKEEEARAKREDTQEQERLKRKLQEEEEKHLREKKVEDERIKRNLESAIQYKLNEDTITQGYRQKLDTALDELDVLEKNTELSEFSKQTKITRKKAQIETLDKIITAR
ncbi:MAG: hypothetical protein H0U49_02175 [Parachlamydiaceae bacterium]|nr:hypothetical protein [Parachlamydiaceae bacterium]